MSLTEVLPNIHPVFVHLPLALLPVALAFDLLSLAQRRQQWLDRAAASLYGLGAIGSVAAYLTGRQAVDSLPDIPAQALTTVSAHSDSALIVVLIFVPLAVIRLALTLKDRRKSAITLVGLRAVLVVVAAVGVWTLFQTGKAGGALVFEHGLGVQAEADKDPAETAEPEGFEESVEADAEAEEETGPQDSAADRLGEDDDGVMSWKPLGRDSEALGEILEFAEGSPSDSVVEVDEEEADEPGLVFDISGESLLVLPSLVDDVQIEMELAWVDFEGTIGAAHHVQSFERFERFSLSHEGHGDLIRRSDGEERSLDDGHADISEGKLKLKVSAAGRHFHGHVDGDMIAHGHASPEPEGRAGIHFDGEGRVRIYSVVVTPL